MEPQTVRAFLAVAETGSFTLAAKEVLRTQSAVSMSVRSLEEEIGQPLFHRSAQGALLTEAGEHLRELTGALLRDWEGIGQHLEQALTGRVHGRLVVGAGEAILLNWLPAVLKVTADR